MTRHPQLTMTKIEPAEVNLDWGSLSYRTPGRYHVTGPTGRVYLVEGTAYGRMERSEWSFRSSDGATTPVISSGSFKSRRACLAVIAKLEARATALLYNRRMEPCDSCA